MTLALTAWSLAGSGSPERLAAQADSAAQAAAATITAADLRLRIGALAHDSMRGRPTPSPELEKAARHIARRFEEYGLRPAAGDSYLQTFPIAVSGAGRPDQQSVDINGPGGGPLDPADFISLPGGSAQAVGPLAVASLGGASVAAGAIAAVHVTEADTRSALSMTCPHCCSASPMVQFD